ncbi:MAG: YggT family protein [Propionibacteriaceae bacterium]|jgi:YggT family protein|nr:YggT family protein [Propionibacteriaceae bacterium]
MATLQLIVMSLLSAYEAVLFARVILSWIVAFNPHWTPRGLLLVVSEVVYTLTDPPIKAIRKVIKPVRLGQVALDLSVLVLFLLIFVAGSVIGAVFAALQSV